MSWPIEATVAITVTHVLGPIVEDADHVRRWLMSPPVSIMAYRGGAGWHYDVCPACPDGPDTCPHDRGPVAIYAAEIIGAAWSGS